MKTIIAGSRTISDYLTVAAAITASGFRITEVVSGCEPKGVDALGERWAKDNNIPIKSFPANWDRFGLSAGPRRNREMASYAQALILIWDGTSRGSKNMKSEALAKGLPVFECIVSDNGVEYRRHNMAERVEQRLLFS